MHSESANPTTLRDSRSIAKSGEHGLMQNRKNGRWGALLAAYSLVLVASLLGGCPPGGPNIPPPGGTCQQCLDTSGCNGDPGCSQARCGSLCGGGFTPQSTCGGCVMECGTGSANGQCYQTNCASMCGPLSTCQACYQQYCWDYNNPAPCMQQQCGSACANYSPIDAGVTPIDASAPGAPSLDAK
jgi:hypothetical protein